MSVVNHMGEPAKHFADWLSVGVVVGAAAELLPSIATVLTIIWMTMRIFDWISAKLAGRRTDHLE